MNVSCFMTTVTIVDDLLDLGLECPCQTNVSLVSQTRGKGMHNELQPNLADFFGHLCDGTKCKLKV